MGQYHHPVCIEAAEGLDPAGMDSGLKEGEQGFNRPSTPAAIVALVCARGGNMPADCSQSPLVGRWAGKRVLIQGDYAEDGDIPGWKGPRLSKLYRAMRPVDERKPKKDWRTTPVFEDITRDACAFLEAACNVRYFEHEQICKDGDPRSETYGQVIDRWTSTHSVQVKPVARHFGNCGVAEYVIADIYDTRDLEYLKRCGMKPEDVQRPPRSGDWHGFLPEEIPEGQHRVIVNLDTLEYIDPVKFGQAPTLAGMVTLASKHPDLPILKKANQDNLQVVDASQAVFSSCSAILSAAAAVTSPLTPRSWWSHMAGTRVTLAPKPPSCSKASKTSKDGGAAAGSLGQARSATRTGRRPRKYSRRGPTSATRSSSISSPSATTKLLNPHWKYLVGVEALITPTLRIFGLPHCAAV